LDYWRTALVTRATQAVEDDDKLDVVLACRPVFTKNQDVAAFELLLHGGDSAQGASLSDIEATSSVILGTYTHIFQGGKVQSISTFLRVTDEVLLAPELPDLPKKQYILEVAARDKVSGALVDRLRSLGRRGYRLALAGFEPDNPALDVLLGVVHIVKLDIATLGLERLQQAVEKLKPYGLDLLADNLHRREDFGRCMGLGFTYYQGDFLSQPYPVKGKKIAGNKLVLLQLLSELHNPHATPSTLEEIAIKDANLTYRILKIVNSAALGFGKEVDSLSHAIALLGMEEIKRWANLFLVDGEKDKPAELTRSMLVRGRMCEILAELSGKSRPVNHFIVGLLSRLDALMDISMEELMRQVPLSQDVKAALVHRQGDLGEILNEVEHYESGRFEALRWLLDKSYYEVAYRHSTAWAQQVQQAMGR
tara:strand:+ start:12057 stop:13322 length:1266 start_codon:yes stop_codon:yes gene_type:complete